MMTWGEIKQAYTNQTWVVLTAGTSYLVKVRRTSCVFDSPACELYYPVRDSTYQVTEESFYRLRLATPQDLLKL